MILGSHWTTFVPPPLIKSGAMKPSSKHEVDIRMMRGGHRIRIVGTRPTIMLSINDVFKGWFEDTDRAWKALDVQDGCALFNDRLS